MHSSGGRALALVCVLWAGSCGSNTGGGSDDAGADLAVSVDMTEGGGDLAADLSASVDLASGDLVSAPDLAPACSPATCAGCCASDGSCQPGTSASACGVGGASCAPCPGGESCAAGVCSGC